MEHTPSKSYVGKIIGEYNKETEKKTRKKEEILYAYVMKATARDQEKNILISHLKTESALRQLQQLANICNILVLKKDKRKLHILWPITHLLIATDSVGSLSIENEMKQAIIKSKDEKIKLLNDEIERLQALLQFERDKHLEDKSNKFSNNNNEIICEEIVSLNNPQIERASTTSKIIEITSTTSNVMPTISSDAIVESTDQAIIPTKKRHSSFKKAKETKSSNFIYNLRKRNKQK